MSENQNKVVEKKKSLADYLTAPMVKTKIAEVIGETNSQQFISAIISAVQTNPQLQNCSQKSILNAALLGQTLGLSPSPQMGQYYMVPYNNKGTMEAVFQIGWKGYVDMAVRTGKYAQLNATEIKEGEFKSFNPLTEQYEFSFIQNFDERKKAKTIGYAAFFTLKSGFSKMLYWTYEEMLAHANKYSKGFAAKKGYTFWEKDFDAMARKTLIRQLISKWGPKFKDFDRAYKSDMAVISDIKNKSVDVEYVDNDIVVENDAKPMALPEQIEIIKAALTGEDITKMCEYYNVEKVEDLTLEQAGQVCTNIQTKKNS